MDFLFPLTHAVSESIGKTIDKLNFRKNNIAARQLIILVFTGMSISLLTYILLSGKPFPDFSLAALGLVITVALVSFIANVFDFASLKVNDLSLREPMLGFVPILAGLVGYVLFPSEREADYLLAFLLGAVAVYFGTHRRKLKKVQRRGMSYLLLGVIFYAFLPTLYKWTLEYISPEYITLFRVVSVLFLTLVFLPPKNWTHPGGKIVYGLLSGVVYSVGTVAGLYAIQKLGVVLSMLLLLVEPALKYSSGYFILGEKVRKGEVISSIALVLIIVLTIL